MAVTESLPAPTKVVVQVAVLVDRATAEQPEIGEEPLVNATVPVGLPAPGAVTETVAVKVSDCPVALGLDEDVRDVVVAAGLTVWATAAEVEAVKLLSPE